MITIPRAGRLIAAAATALLLLLPAVPAGASTADRVEANYVATDHGTTDHVIVQTDEGALRGVSGNGVDSFLGIPYAAPPVGLLRWHPPQPARALVRACARPPATAHRCAAAGQHQRRPHRPPRTACSSTSSAPPV